MEYPDLTRLLKPTAAQWWCDRLSQCLGARLDIYDVGGRSVTGATQLDADHSLVHPIELDGRRVGYLALYPTDVSASEQSAWLARLSVAADLLAAHLAQLYINRDLAQETLDRYREINLLYRVQEAIGRHPDIDAIGELILNQSMRVIQVAAGALLLLSDNGAMLITQTTRGMQDPPTHLSLQESIAGWVVRHRQGVIVNDVAEEPRCGPADQHARSLLCAPLLVGEKCIGALVLYNKKNGILTASDQKLLAALASQAAVAIETAREIQIREQRLKAQIRQLRIEIDEMRQKQQVATITATDYFARLQQVAAQMRQEFEQE